jgi:FkbM family methyltransferase
MFPRIEKLIAQSIGLGNRLSQRLVPPEYLYSLNSWRQVERKGIKLKLDLSNVVDHEIFFNVSDISFEKFIDEIADAQMVWDIGANIGWTAHLLKKKFPGATIYAFEPSSKNRSRLQENIELNKFDIQVVPYGLSDSPAKVKLYSVLSTNPGMNRILNTEENLPYEIIDVIVGDSFWHTIGSPKVDILKIDVEGFEMAVLNGLTELLDECHPTIFVEVDNKNLRSNNSSAFELLQFLSFRRYQIFSAQSNSILSYPFKSLSEHFDIIAK